MVSVISAILPTSYLKILMPVRETITQNFKYLQWRFQGRPNHFQHFITDFALDSTID